MRITPLHDRVLVRRLEEGEQTIGGIIVPDSAREKPQAGEVIAVGKGRLDDGGRRIPLTVQAGDRILFGKFAQEITLGGEAYVILREDEVLAVTDRSPTKKKNEKHSRTKTRPPKKLAKKVTRIAKPKKKQRAMPRRK